MVAPESISHKDFFALQRLEQVSRCYWAPSHHPHIIQHHHPPFLYNLDPSNSLLACLSRRLTSCGSISLSDASPSGSPFLVASTQSPPLNDQFLHATPSLGNAPSLWATLHPSVPFPEPSSSASKQTHRREVSYTDRPDRSEAAIGIVTTLNALGLQEQMRARDLATIRKWFLRQDKSKHIQRVFALAGAYVKGTFFCSSIVPVFAHLPPSIHSSPRPCIPLLPTPSLPPPIPGPLGLSI